MAAFAATAPTISRDMLQRYAKHRGARHRTVALLHECFGGLHPEAERFFGECAKHWQESHCQAQGKPTWAARRMPEQALQSISIAIHSEVAREILDRIMRESEFAAEQDSPP